ncbi:MAG: GlsB/YeaQ/YmgE family stress response membrane protein [Chloroflexota bacterium]
MTLTLHPGNVIAWIIIGLLAGAIAGRIARGRGYGCLGDIILGLVGALVGGIIVSFFVKGTQVAGFLGTLGVALLGALVLIILVRAVRGTLF